MGGSLILGRSRNKKRIVGAVGVVIARVVARSAAVVAIAKTLPQPTQRSATLEGVLSLTIFGDCANEGDGENCNQNFFKRHNNHLFLWDRIIVRYRHFNIVVPSILAQ